MHQITMSHSLNIHVGIEDSSAMYRRDVPTHASLIVGNCVGEFRSRVIGAKMDEAVEEIREADMDMQVEQFADLTAALMQRVGFSEAKDDALQFYDTDVPTCRWNLIGDVLKVRSEAYQFDTTMKVDEGAKDADIVAVMMYMLLDARLRGLEARYKLLMRQVVSRT